MPAVGRVQPHRLADDLGGLPLVARPDMGVEEGVGVAEDLDVHPPIARIPGRADVLDRGRNQVDVSELAHPLTAGQVGEPVDARDLGHRE